LFIKRRGKGSGGEKEKDLFFSGLPRGGKHGRHKISKGGRIELKRD